MLNTREAFLPDMRLIGLSASIKNDKSDVARLWEKLSLNLEKLQGIPKNKTFIQVAFWDDNRPDFFTVMASIIAGNDTIALVPFQETRISASYYLAYKHKGPLDVLQESYSDLYLHILPETMYRPSRNYNLELYHHTGINMDDPSSELEILIPIEKD